VIGWNHSEGSGGNLSTPVPILFTPRRYVDECIFEECRKDKQKADGHPDVDRLDVGDSRQAGVDARTLSRRREDGEEAEGNAGWGGIDVDPEGHPGQDDDQNAWNVDLNHEVADVTTESKEYLETRCGTCSKEE